jgi:hypothetical protein
MTIVGAGGFACVLVVNGAAPDLGAEAEAYGLVLRMAEVRKAGEPVIIPSPSVDDYSIVLALRERPIIYVKTAELGMGHFTEVTSTETPLPQNPYQVGDPDHPLPQNPWLVDLAGLRAKWKAPSRVWFVGRQRDVSQLRDARLDVHVFAEKDDAAIATNLPLPDGR